MPRPTTRKTKPGSSDFARKRGKAIRLAREQREPEPWSQSKLAEAVRVTPETVYQWEAAGVEEIDFVTCVLVAKELEVAAKLRGVGIDVTREELVEEIMSRAWSLPPVIDPASGRYFDLVSGLETVWPPRAN
jgi:transcriptional regulator with XRE-family HTH domain